MRWSMVCLMAVSIGPGCGEETPTPPADGGSASTAEASGKPAGEGRGGFELPREVVVADDAAVVTGGEGCDGCPDTLPRADVPTINRLIAEADEAGQVLVIDFWATWCVPCVAMFDPLHEGLVAMGETVRPVTVSFDGGAEGEAKALAFLIEHHATKDGYLADDPAAQDAIVDAFAPEWDSVVVPRVLVFRDGELVDDFAEGGREWVEPILGRVAALAADAASPATRPSQP